MDDDFELVTLRNGARAVRHKGHGEVMHPAVGPWAEANALYVRQSRLVEHLQQPTAEPLRVYDVGLGAAANAVAALTAWRAARPGRPLEIHSFEIDLAPLRLALQDEAGFPFLSPWKGAIDALMAGGSYEEDGLQWRLYLGDALDCIARAPGPAAIVFHDPFSPAANPALWSPGAFKLLRSHSMAEGEGTTLFTYSTSTRTRVSLLLGGFFVGAGDPVGGRSETTVAATRRDLLRRPLDARFMQRWARSSARAPWGSELTPELEALLRAHPQFGSGEP